MKALTQFPTVLANMDENLSWTSSLGDAYVNQQQDVMNAVQVTRSRGESREPEDDVAGKGEQ